MPFTLSKEKYADVHFAHGFCNGNIPAAVEGDWETMTPR
jgi:hypothetical protein